MSTSGPLAERSGFQENSPGFNVAAVVEAVRIVRLKSARRHAQMTRARLMPAVDAESALGF